MEITLISFKTVSFMFCKPVADSNVNYYKATIEGHPDANCEVPASFDTRYCEITHLEEYTEYRVVGKACQQKQGTLETCTDVNTETFKTKIKCELNRFH